MVQERERERERGEDRREKNGQKKKLKTVNRKSSDPTRYFSGCIML